MMKEDVRGGEHLKAQIFSALEWIMFILLLGGLAFNDDIRNITGWTGTELLFFGLIIYIFSIVCIECLKVGCLEKAGYEIKGLERWGARLETGPTTSGYTPIAAAFTSAGTKATVDIVRIWEYMDYHYSMPHTRIIVKHAGEMPCVVEVRYGKISLFDKHAYMEWKKRDLDPRDVPTESRINDNMAAEWIRHIFDNQNISELKGILRIEPEQVYFLQEGEFLEGKYLKDAANVLIGLSRKIGKGYYTKSKNPYTS